jgi:hypothetical protein
MEEQERAPAWAGAYWWLGGKQVSAQQALPRHLDEAEWSLSPPGRFQAFQGAGSDGIDYLARDL